MQENICKHTLGRENIKKPETAILGTLEAICQF